MERSLVLKALQLLLGLVFAGWLMVWIMRPTNTYRNDWSPKLISDTNSTYFGRQGTNILIYAFPILFISVLGCIYLHLLKKSGNTERGKSSSRLAAWKRPVLVKGPLGIVSAIELAFSLLFLALLIWCFSSYLTISFAKLHQNDKEKLWETKLEVTGLRLGLIGNLCCAFLFFPVTRGSSLLPLIGLTSESSIKYHVWLGHIVMVLFSAHGVCYILYWAVTNQTDEMIKWGNTGIANVPGELALICGLILWATTFPRIRRKMFELFFYSHQLYILFLFFYLLHVGISFFCYILPGIYLFMIDRYLRFLQSRTKVRLVSARLLPSEAIELNFSKSSGFGYNPLSTVFINVPSVSSLQWHPYTVSSNSNLEPERLSVIIKKEGSWTQKLYRTLSSPLPNDRLDVSVEGPYSPTSMNFLRYDSLVMVSGGSGITPFISIIRELIYRINTLNAPTPRVLLICAFKTSVDLTMLDLLLPISGDVSDLSRLQLRIEAFVTREEAATDESQSLIRTIWFKPIPSDKPVAPVLGPNSWLWLGAIVSSSFVAFLLLIGILQRYYINPIEQNTNTVYSYSTRAVLNLLFICVCVAAAASAGFLWNKSGNYSKEAKQIQSTDAPTPTTSPSSWFYNADRELESVPQESLVKATKVHFGGRPDLKKILLEIDGSNVGVMASGPRGMRHEVAAICSSGLADNLHFESISFSW
ncbi:ferric reduction oxidase 2-like [Typha latifolia]|uniref:ferric reduction oxidase 2-like n=1 Tax=Typha latifolia TaxID=4733 RepID=UPI003C2D298F